MISLKQLPDSSYIESTRKQAMDDYIITVNTSKYKILCNFGDNCNQSLLTVLYSLSLWTMENRWF